MRGSSLQMALFGRLFGPGEFGAQGAAEFTLLGIAPYTIQVGASPAVICSMPGQFEGLFALDHTPITQLKFCRNGLNNNFTSNQLE
ncbi:MAG: hypothetical protein ACK2UM_19740 [Anaerolineales bacterium]